MPRPYARLMIRSGFTSSTVRITSSNCVMSPRTTGAPIGTSPNAAAPGFRSIPTTVSPRAISFRMSRGPMKPVAPMTRVDMLRVRDFRGLPRDHAPVVGPRVDRQITDGEPLLLARVLDVHLRHAVHDPDVAVHARLPVPRGNAAIVRLAGLEVADVLGLRFEPRGRVHVRQVVGERGVERSPVLRAHGVEASLVGAQDVGLGSGWLGRDGGHEVLPCPERVEVPR